MTELKDILTHEQALFIKKVFSHGTYRFVAAQVAEKYPELEINHGNQIDGMELVDASKIILEGT